MVHSEPAKREKGKLHKAIQCLWVGTSPIMHLNTAKCKVRYLGTENRGHTYRMENWTLAVSDSEKNNGSYWIISLTWACSQLLWQRVCKDILDIYTWNYQVEMKMRYYLQKQHCWKSATGISNACNFIISPPQKDTEPRNVQTRVTKKQSNHHRNTLIIRIQSLISYAQEKLKLWSVNSYRKKLTAY